MKNKVTVIPVDKLVIVNGEALQFEFNADDNIHAIQWLSESGHVEFKDKTPNMPADYEQDVMPFVTLWEAEWDRTHPPVPEPTLEEVKILKLNEINTEYTKQAEMVKLNTPMDEVLTWDIQRLEAQAWRKDSAVETPNADKLALARGIDRILLLEKILGKVDAYEQYIFTLTGLRQKYEDQIKVATTTAELSAITWEITNVENI